MSANDAWKALIDKYDILEEVQKEVLIYYVPEKK